MKNAIILHGKPSKEGYYEPSRESQSNEHWLPWLQHELIIRDILTQTPELPTPFQPVYDEWERVFEAFQPNDESILVGHSAGAGFLLRWLSEDSNRKASKVMLVAPSLGLDWDHKGFFDFEIATDLVNRVGNITIFTATNDKQGILDSAKLINNKLSGINNIELPTGGHFTYKDMGQRKFPELLDEILS